MFVKPFNFVKFVTYHKWKMPKVLFINVCIQNHTRWFEPCKKSSFQLTSSLIWFLFFFLFFLLRFLLVVQVSGEVSSSTLRLVCSSVVVFDSNSVLIDSVFKGSTLNPGIYRINGISMLLIENCRVMNDAYLWFDEFKY